MPALAALEESGNVVAPPNLAALAALIGLGPDKLEGIAKGWLPTGKNLSQWCELRHFSTEEEGMAVNNYLVWDEVSREAALFDTGWNAKAACAVIGENQLQLGHIF